MSHFVEVKTAELSGAALNWAVAIAVGYSQDKEDQHALWSLDGNVVSISVEGYRNGYGFSPSTNWAHGGPLLDKYPWALPYKTGAARYRLGEFEACTKYGRACNGGTPLIAACRIIVAEKLGGMVWVPAELMEIK